MITSPTGLGSLICGLLILTVTGCQKGPEAPSEVTVNIPETVTEDGTEWKKQAALSQADNDCLINFFAQNGDLVGSPEFDGQPAVFMSGKSDRRFYWLQPSVDGVRWRRVDFWKRKFSMTDGTGNPFE